MFILLLSYKKTLEDIELYLVQHREFLERYYQAGIFIMSGPKVPRTGGVILVNSMDKNSLQEIIKEDPFYQYELADYDIIEFIPAKHQLENLSTATTFGKEDNDK